MYNTLVGYAQYVLRTLIWPLSVELRTNISNPVRLLSVRRIRNKNPEKHITKQEKRRGHGP